MPKTPKEVVECFASNIDECQILIDGTCPYIKVCNGIADALDLVPDEMYVKRA